MSIFTDENVDPVEAEREKQQLAMKIFVARPQAGQIDAAFALAAAFIAACQARSAAIEKRMLVQPPTFRR